MRISERRFVKGGPGRPALETTPDAGRPVVPSATEGFGLSDGGANDPTLTRAGSSAAADSHEPLPTRIGDYRILGFLGRGAMGVVYEAEQRSPARVVALKVVRGGAAVDDERLAMFRREIDVLARLEHPLIARIYESGRTTEGLHFFAMELVRGRTLSDYLRRDASLDNAELRRRLAMLAEIAEAVNYAHQRGVIHRDLKPSNLLVTEGEPDAPVPRVKILDFGLARITDGDVLATRVTEIGVIKGTLAYMSPEQARGRPDEIDVRTDVYALGAILYEMLAGALPHDLGSLSVVEALRVIEQGRVRSLRTIWKGTRRLDGDVETIVAKALERDANDRYGSAAALATDIRRYLASQPILARPPSTVYQLRKLVRRNPLPTAFAGLVALLLVAFAGSMAWQARRLAIERDRAQAEADRATAIQGFLKETLETANPQAGGGRDVTILEALDRSLGRIDTAFANQPLVEADVRETLGAAYSNLGEYVKAEVQLRRAVDLYVGHKGPRDADTATAWGELSRLYHMTGRYDEAIDAANNGIEAQRAADPGNARLGERLNDLAYALFFSGRVDDAETPIEEAIAIGRAQPSPTRWLAESLQLQADVLSNQGKLDEAEPLAIEALDLYEKTFGEDHPMVNQGRNTLAILLLRKGEYERAETVMLERLESTKRLLGDKHPDVAVALENLGNVYYRSGRPEKTLELLDQAAAVRREALGPNDPAVGRTLFNRGMVLWYGLNRLEEAEASIVEGIGLMSAGEGANHPDVAAALAVLASLRTARGDDVGAERALREALRIRIFALGEKHRQTAESRIDLGLNLLSRGVRHAEARSLLSDGVEVLAPAAGDDDARVKAARAALDK